MNVSSDSKKSGSSSGKIFKKGLGTTLLLWFLALSILPVVTVGYISYENAYNRLKKDAESALGSAINLKSEQIKYYFQGILTDLKLESERQSNTQFLSTLVKSFNESQKKIKEFTQSFKWALIAEENGTDLEIFRRTYNYYDVFLIGAQGDILFTVAQEDDLGTNLFNGKYSDTLFAQACRKSLETGRPVFSDYETYEPSGNKPSGFCVALIVNDLGDKIGLIAFQFHLDGINRIMQSDLGLGRTAEAYLVGIDLKLRSDSVLGPEKKALTAIVETKQTLLWRESVKKRLDPESSGRRTGGLNPDEKIESSGAFLYKGPHDENKVLGIHSGFDIKGIPFGVIAEIGEKEAFASVRSLRQIVIVLILSTIVIVVLVAFFVSRRIVHPVKLLTDGARQVSQGNLEYQISIVSSDEIGKLTKSFNEMSHKLLLSRQEEERQSWMQEGLSNLDDILRGEKDLDVFSSDLVTFICNYVQAQIGLFYIKKKNDLFQLAAGFAVKPGQGALKEFKAGEGLIGQSVTEQKIKFLSQIPELYFKVSSALGEHPPAQVAIIPFIFNGVAEGVMEIGVFEPFSESHKDFLRNSSERIAIAANSISARIKLDNALERTIKQAETLKNQQEELASANEELEEQTQMLSASEESLKKQQEELQVSNEELEEKTEYLERSKKEIETKNTRLEEFQVEINKKAEDLAVASKYKSEFLANMSHELRTPLNSLLLLAKLMSENREKNLSQDQLESVKIIYNSGNDLLSLINEILDLSKIEAGKMDLNISDFSLMDFKAHINSSFKHMAHKKNLGLSIIFHENCPAEVTSDFKRIEQILKNLISNALKFTEDGSVQIEFFRPGKDVQYNRPDLVRHGVFAISVQDTGIGIPEDKLESIFNAFLQLEGGISRKFGGTGLGLSISRELANLLGGEIQLESRIGKGSKFSIYLPVRLTQKPVDDEVPVPVEAPDRPLPVVEENGNDEKRQIQESVIPDDRYDIKQMEKSVLIVEDDLNFGKVLMKFCRQKGFKCIFSDTGEKGILLAQKYLPKAIILDIRLPGIDGWEVLDALKAEPATRHIPVHFMSVDEPLFDAFSKGAIGYLTKPVSDRSLIKALEKIDSVISKKRKELLIVEDNDAQRMAIRKLIGNNDVVTDEARTGKEALKALAKKDYDCMILDLGLPDMSGFDLLEGIKKIPDRTIPPIVVYTGRDLTLEQENTLRSYSRSIIIKGAKSEKRLLDETSLFLHRVVGTMSKEKRTIIADIHDSDQMFDNKTVLIVDDDMRNVFALSKVLSLRGMNIVKAENGQKALSVLDKRRDIDLVLMDVMMPVMDGYETMKQIRQKEIFSNLPIIALTAKAMKQDKARCIEAGANDYLAKPVDISRLLSMMRVWLYG